MTNFAIKPTQKVFLFLCLVGATIVVSSSISLGQERNKGMPFTCIQWGDLPHTDIFFRDGRDSVPIKLIKNRRSETLFLKSFSSGVFQLYIQQENESGEIQPVLVGSANLIPAATRTVFILKKAPKESKLPIAILALEDSFETFPPGTFRFHNYSAKTLPIVLGDKKQAIAPNSVKVMKPNISSRGKLVSLLVYNDSGKAVFGRRLFGQPRDRVMIIFTDSSNPKAPVDSLIIPHIVPNE